MVYAHNLGGLLVVAQFASLPLLPAVNVKWGYAAFTLVGLAAICSPVLVLSAFVDQTHPSSGGALELEQLYTAALTLAPGGRGGRLLLLGFGIVFALAVRELVLVLRRWGRSHAAWIRGLVVLWLALPPMLLLAISVVKPLFADRYLIGVFPGVAVMTGAVIAGAEAKRTCLGGGRPVDSGDDRGRGYPREAVAERRGPSRSRVVGREQGTLRRWGRILTAVGSRRL